MNLNEVVKVFKSLDPKKQCEWIITSIWDDENFLELIEQIGNDETKDIIKILTICNYFVEKDEPLYVENIYPLWIEYLRDKKLNELLNEN